MTKFCRKTEGAGKENKDSTKSRFSWKNTEGGKAHRELNRGGALLGLNFMMAAAGEEAVCCSKQTKKKKKKINRRKKNLPAKESRRSKATFENRNQMVTLLMA